MSTITDEEILKLADEHDLVDLRTEGKAWAYHSEADVDIREQVLAFARALLAPKPRSSDRTRAALAEVEKGAPVAPTARKYGIQPSTLFRARARVREAAERPEAPTPSRAGRRS